MTINVRDIFTKRIFALAALCAFLGAWTLVTAQVDPGMCRIVQDGVTVGEIYVPAHAPHQSLYAEHWILYPNYVYPSASHPVKTEIVPSAGPSYSSEEDFFARAPFGPGFRYVHVTSNDSTRLPGRY